MGETDGRRRGRPMGSKTLSITYAKGIEPTSYQLRAMRTFFKATGACSVHVLRMNEAPVRHLLVAVREALVGGSVRFSVQTIGRTGKTLTPSKTPGTPPRQEARTKHEAIELFEHASRLVMERLSPSPGLRGIGTLREASGAHARGGLGNPEKIRAALEALMAAAQARRDSER